MDLQEKGTSYQLCDPSEAPDACDNARHLGLKGFGASSEHSLHTRRNGILWLQIPVSCWNLATVKGGKTRQDQV